MVSVLIYKILLPSEWAEFQDRGRFDGSPFDGESGFIHLSSRDQVAETARRVFGGESSLVIVAVDSGAVDDTLRWEPADRGTFPHVYGSIPLAAVTAVHEIGGAAEVADLPL
jgi:uncharacterized protein (DUF952 family)